MVSGNGCVGGRLLWYFSICIWLWLSCRCRLVGEGLCVVCVLWNMKFRYWLLLVVICRWCRVWLLV